jgi:hypothetical protein
VTLALPILPEPGRHVVPRARRTAVEWFGEEEGRVLHIIESGVAPSGLRHYAETTPLTVPIPACGTTGTWTLTPTSWRVGGLSAIGDVLGWTPNVHLGGGPAAFDLAAVVSGVPVRWKSSGTSVPSELGSMYVQGDYGTARLPALFWQVRADEIADGVVTLALGYRAGEGDMILGHASVASTISVVNHGPIG